MAKRYDAAIKQLVEAHPEDWIAFMNLPPGPVTVIDADVSAVSPAADKVIRVDAAEPYIAHLEFQASSDSEFDRRMLMYNALLRWRHKLPVKSIAVLLRPEASSSGTTGRFVDAGDAESHLEFRYRLVRVWELSPEALLAGGIGTLPLAPIARTTELQLPAIFREIEDRLRVSTDSDATDARTSAFVLLGLRYPLEVGRQLLLGVRQMKESVTYQAIVEEGRIEGLSKGRDIGKAEGAMESARDAIVRIGRHWLKEPTSEFLKRLNAIEDINVLHSIEEKLPLAKDWQSLLESVGE